MRSLRKKVCPKINEFILLVPYYYFFRIAQVIRNISSKLGKNTAIFEEQQVNIATEIAGCVIS